MKRFFAAAMAAMTMGAAATASPEDDRQAVAALDTGYQAAVKANDAETMARILHPGMVLVVGRGTVYTREDLLAGARNKDVIYERQDEIPGTQTVRLYGSGTAVVTALLWIKGASGGQAFERKLWFSDTYVRTPEGWKYAFGQASIALPAEAQ